VTASAEEGEASVGDSGPANAEEHEASVDEEHEASVDEESETTANAEVGLDEERDVDRGATSFVEVEQELDSLGEGQRAKAQAIDVEQVSASAVPEDYPVRIETDDALELTLELLGRGGRTVQTYFEWPDPAPSDRLATLLELTDVPVDRFGDLHGKTILVTVEDGYYLPVLPEEGLRGDDRAIYALAAGMAPPALVALAGIFGVGTGIVTSTLFVIIWLLATLLLVPLAVYSDAWHLRSRTDWEGGPLFWATLSAIPMAEIMLVPLYLFSRSNAEPLG